MNKATLIAVSTGILSGVFSAGVIAEPVTYIVDSSHTFPAFEADHWGGLSIWRGNIEQTSGSIVLDKEAESGTVDVTMNMSSIDFGHDGMNQQAMSANILDVEQFPTATYTGQLADFENGAPTVVEGTLTMHGVSRPIDLMINQFKCQPHFRHGREVCGADASATFNRDDFGVDYDKENGFFMAVDLLITIEAGIPQ